MLDERTRDWVVSGTSDPFACSTSRVTVPPAMLADVASMSRATRVSRSSEPRQSRPDLVHFFSLIKLDLDLLPSL